MIASRRILATPAILLSLCGLAAAQGVYPGVAARVNGTEISYQRFHHAYEEYLAQNHVNIVTTRDPKKLSEFRRQTMDLMIEQELVWQAAEKAGITAEPAAVDAALAEMQSAFSTREELTRRLEAEGFTEETYRAHLAHAIAASLYLDRVRDGVAAVSDAELEAFYRENEHRLTLPEQVRVRHILLTWKPMGKPDDRAALREQMGDILRQAREGSDFAALARTYSEDSTSADGGDVGFFGRGEMAAAFEEAAFALEVGEVSEIVETPFGVHILKSEERRKAELLPLDEIREDLRDFLRDERSDEAVRQETTGLRQAAAIEILIPL